MAKKTETQTVDAGAADFELPPVQPAQSVTHVPAPKMAGLPATDSMAVAANMMSIIEKMAENPNVEVDKMTAILDMQERIWNKQAEIAFNRDFALMSQVMPRIKKTRGVSYKDKEDGNKLKEAFKYALFENIDEVVRPLIDQFGFSLSFTSEPRDGGGLVVTGILAHREGHSRKTSLPLAIDTSGGKSNLQGMGSTSSYGRRYATCILLNLITVNEDTDGRGDHIETDEAVRIDQQIAAFPDAAAYKPKFLAYMAVERVDLILEKDHQKALVALAEKQKKVDAEKKKESAE